MVMLVRQVIGVIMLMSVVMFVLRVVYAVIAVAVSIVAAKGISSVTGQMILIILPFIVLRRCLIYQWTALTIGLVAELVLMVRIVRYGLHLVQTNMVVPVLQTVLATWGTPVTVMITTPQYILFATLPVLRVAKVF